MVRNIPRRQHEPTRDEDGKFPTFAWPGGYTIHYLCEDGGVLCPDCVNDQEEVYCDDDIRNGMEDPEDPQWYIIGVDTHDEGLPLACDHCGKEMESSYGPTDCDYQDMIRDWIHQLGFKNPSNDEIDQALDYVRDMDSEDEGNYHDVGTWTKEWYEDYVGRKKEAEKWAEIQKMPRRDPIEYEALSYGGYLVKHVRTGEDCLIQVDYDFPSLARDFGWTGRLLLKNELRKANIKDDDKMGAEMYSAIQYLDEHEGEQAEDPGYFID